MDAVAAYAGDPQWADVQVNIAETESPPYRPIVPIAYPAECMHAKAALVSNVGCRQGGIGIFLARL